MVFRSNPGFIFHDSCGFEAGGATEFENVKTFIAVRSKAKKLQEQVHAIWYINNCELSIVSFSQCRYCIPMDDSRPFTTAEISFFSTCGTGSGEAKNTGLLHQCHYLTFSAVPVIALFTKFDALDDQAYASLKNEKCLMQEARQQAPLRAVADFEKWYLVHLKTWHYPPKGHVYLRSEACWSLFLDAI